MRRYTHIVAAVKCYSLIGAFCRRIIWPAQNPAERRQKDAENSLFLLPFSPWCTYHNSLSTTTSSFINFVVWVLLWRVIPCRTNTHHLVCLLLLKTRLFIIFFSLIFSLFLFLFFYSSVLFSPSFHGWISAQLYHQHAQNKWRNKFITPA